MTSQSAPGPVAALAHVLIVDSHDDDRERLQAQLAAAPFEVAVAATGGEARKRLSAREVDAVVVDPDLPDGDGFELVRRMAGEGPLVFVVTAGDDDALPDHAYSSGAADFAYKPIARNELLARLRKAIRERGAPEGGRAPRLVLRREERLCIVAGKEIALTRNERGFLACLVDAPRHFATYRELIDAVWGETAKVETQSLRVLAAQVRRKIERAGTRPLLHTVIGEGFRLDI